MDGIDISAWQTGIDLGSVPCDFAIVKATEGTGYTNPDCDRAVQQCIELGKLWGVYHYVNGSGAQDEADYFIDQCSEYIGHGILCVDWESWENSAWGNTDYLMQLVQRVIDRTGVKPLIYASASSFPWDVAQALDCGAWVAQYADNNATGYQDEPWNEGAYDCVIRQYSSHGSLDGYSGNLDINKAYITAEEWRSYQGSEEDIMASKEEVASEILGYKNEDMDFKFWGADVYQYIWNAGRMLTYKNEEVNGSKDVYQLLTDASKAAEKVEALEAKVGALETKLDAVLAALNAK